jgi:hypothetical protein
MTSASIIIIIDHTYPCFVIPLSGNLLELANNDVTVFALRIDANSAKTVFPSEY